ncbi:hypothetical protein [Sphingobacterium gobiense]|uniref:Uncharacterized protein n=1 Tax=Sphingobacterium gobiense TaxID=1382456 RepID=A0A2S9JUC8_9SPHI|nr:hypothetical protein [Sphingobacterium gobiense]PRD56741.1 hypothetical protein C5749_05800 [Sphingobacterium gobiense]
MNYNLSDFISKYKDADYITLITEVPKEVQQLDARYLRLKRNEDDNGLTYYRKHVGDFLFYLNTGVVPSGIQITGLREFLPIIEDLVRKGQFNATALDIFNNTI